ncbi:class I SAM-dependent methyltransferase [Celerinatantimonas yamalensis]|uniref:Ribosomal RNA small subunit methyltransferase J n=1 Tax=Celerinatantimonas yamalensis TaxID=559956 RepID=A0ABW9GBN2_9GAMM
MIPLFCQESLLQTSAQQLASTFDLPLSRHRPEQGLYLEYTLQGLSLYYADEPKLNGICVDFVHGRSDYRRKYGGAEAVTKALGIKKGQRPVVLDATAGLGRDAFVVASLGCQVRMVERSAAVAAMLSDGLARARLNAELSTWIDQRLSLHYASSLQALADIGEGVDAVYLDPMYPHKKKSAQVKKEMRLFQLLVGDDHDADGLLEAARATNAKRIVVKRPSFAEPLNKEKPQAELKTKNHRFDIYLR